MLFNRTKCRSYIDVTSVLSSGYNVAHLAIILPLHDRDSVSFVALILPSRDNLPLLLVTSRLRRCHDTLALIQNQIIAPAVRC
jgi:hypothetical protein